MNLAEVLSASLVVVLGTSTAAQLWSQALRGSWELAQREAKLHRLEALLLASEGKAREVAASQGPGRDCEEAAGQLVPWLQALSMGGGAPASLSMPPSAPGMLHLRWELDGLQRERLLSASALGLCREERHGR